MQLLCTADKLVAVHLRHVEVTEQKVERTGNRLLDNLESVLGRERWDNAVSAGLQQEGSDGERLFVVVYAENRLLRSQGQSHFFRWAAVMAAPADGPGERIGWFASARPDDSGVPHGSGPDDSGA